MLVRWSSSLDSLSLWFYLRIGFIGSIFGLTRAAHKVHHNPTKIHEQLQLCKSNTLYYMRNVDVLHTFCGNKQCVRKVVLRLSTQHTNG